MFNIMENGVFDEQSVAVKGCCTYLVKIILKGLDKFEIYKRIRIFHMGKYLKMVVQFYSGFKSQYLNNHVVASLKN